MIKNCNIVLGVNKSMKQILSHDCLKNKKPIIVTDDSAGEILCGACGIVLKEKTVDRLNNTRILSKEDYFTKLHNGSPSKIYMYDMGNSSVISNNNTDSNGNYFSSQNKYHFFQT